MQRAQATKTPISRSLILRAILVLYIVLSAAWILFSQFRAYTEHVFQEAYLESRITTIEELLDEAEATCDPFFVYAGDRQVELINVACLLPQDQDEMNQLSPLEPPGE